MKNKSPPKNKLLARLLDASVDGLLAFDLEYRYTAWNSAMERMSGLRREEVLGKKAFEVFPFLREMGEDKYFYEALAGRSAVAETRRYIIPETGRCGFFDAHYLPLFNDAGKVEGGLAVIRDITARREADAALMASEERYRAFIANSSEAIWRCELEHPVPTDAPEDEQVELFYRDGYLAECNDALARMYGFSRAEEIVGARIGELLIREDPKNEGYLRAFVRSGYRLIEDILEVSRIVTGKLRVNLRPIELASVIEAAREAVQPAAQVKGIRVDYSSDVANTSVLGDSDRLQQVIWNLLSNAVKFTPHGGRVSIRLARAGAFAEITVSDTGEGIPPEFLPHVFDRFRQADMGMSRRHGGLGLGLAIVRHLVEMHGGSVTAESGGRGHGSTFMIRLPLRSAEASARPLAGILFGRKTGEVQKARNASLAGIRLLVVEDEPDSLELLKVVLSTYGAEVITANCAREALKIVERMTPDVLISDVGMPEMDGYELMRRLRSDTKKCGEMPAIALWAYAREEDRNRALDAGFREHVAKPVDPATLVKLIANLASRA